MHFEQCVVSDGRDFGVHGRAVAPAVVLPVVCEQRAGGDQAPAAELDGAQAGAAGGRDDYG